MIADMIIGVEYDSCEKLDPASSSSRTGERMIVRKRDTPIDEGAEGRAEEYGPFKSLNYSDTGGLTQFGAYAETLQPGSRSSERHWHEQDDEFV